MQNPENVQISLQTARYVYQGRVSIVCEYLMWHIYISLIRAVILESLCESDIYSFFIFPGKQCALFMSLETFMCTPLKLTRHHGGENNIWENEPLGFHHGECFRLMA